jgi:predicted CopG family antitoxin
MNMVQQNRKTIVVTDKTETLRSLGTVTESFNDVICRLIQKAATGQSSFEGHIGQSAVVDRNDPEVKAEAEAITAK